MNASRARSVIGDKFLCTQIIVPKFEDRRIIENMDLYHPARDELRLPAVLHALVPVELELAAPDPFAPLPLPEAGGVSDPCVGAGVGFGAFGGLAGLGELVDDELPLPLVPFKLSPPFALLPDLA